MYTYTLPAESPVSASLSLEARIINDVVSTLSEDNTPYLIIMFV